MAGVAVGFRSSGEFNLSLLVGGRFQFFFPAFDNMEGKRVGGSPGDELGQAFLVDVREIAPGPPSSLVFHTSILLRRLVWGEDRPRCGLSVRGPYAD